MGKGSGKRPHVSRTGEHHTPWTTSDIRYLRENAGHVPVAEIARHLKRSQQAIRSRACILGVSIRCYRRTMVQQQIQQLSQQQNLHYYHKVYIHY